MLSLSLYSQAGLENLCAYFFRQSSRNKKFVSYAPTLYTKLVSIAFWSIRDAYLDINVALSTCKHDNNFKWMLLSPLLCSLYVPIFF